MDAPESQAIVSDRKLRSLAPHLRIAWAAMVCERVLRRFSDHFRIRYHQTQTVELALKFAKSPSKIAASKFNELYRQLEEAEEMAEADGYELDCVYPAKALLFEIDQQRGRLARQAVAYATVAFAHHQAFRQGFTLANRALPAGYYLDLSIPAHDFSLQLFDVIRKSCCPSPDDATVRELDIDMAMPPPPPQLKKVLASNATMPPPRWEVVHIKKFYAHSS